MINVAVLYICTGRYKCFFSDFYNSCEHYFLNGIANIEYFVFTDDLHLSNANNVNIVEKECRGFPLDSLFRFDMFLSIKDKLVNFDYIYFFNSNTLFIDYIGIDILPLNNEKLVGAEWPFRYNYLKHSSFYPYERNKKSLAYIYPFESKPYVYYMGGLNGGVALDYIHMIETLSCNIRKDYENGIIACAHDESHINNYFRIHSCKLLPFGYCCPEEWVTNKIRTKIVFRDKSKIDSYFNKGRDSSLKGKLIKILRVIWRSIEWYI